VRVHRLRSALSQRQDLRRQPLIERKAALKGLLRRKRSRILYLDHVEGDGRLLFEQIVAMDLEGIVCEHKDSPNKVTEKTFALLDQGEELAVQPIGRA
jgi:ATP-dependent DNA ligase